MVVPTIADEVFHVCNKLGVNVARKAVARVVNQDAHEHDGIVLVVTGRVGRSGQVFANAHRSLFRSGRTGLGNFDDTREVYEFTAVLEGVSSVRATSRSLSQLTEVGLLLDSTKVF